jgi:uncharacterized protein (TIGR00725 family)
MSDSQKIKLSVYGAPHTDYQKSFNALEKAQELGTVIAKHDCITIVPSTSGFPYWVAKGAKESEGSVLGFSPAANEQEHVEVYDLPTKYMDAIIYSGFGYAGSDLLISRSSDAVIFGYGGVETIHEFWVAFQEDKPIGVLKGQWSTDEVLHDLLKDNPDFDHQQIIFDDDPKRLVEQLIKRAKKQRVHEYHL